MTPAVTPLLKIANEHGCATHLDKAMLDGQLVEVLHFSSSKNDSRVLLTRSHFMRGEGRALPEWTEPST